MEEELSFFRATHNPRTTLLNAMRHLATDADVEWHEVQASSIYTLTDALVELITDERLRRHSPRFRERIPVLFMWEENEEEQREHTFTITVSRFGCALHSRRFFEPGTGVRLGGEGKTIQGSVVYSLKDYSRKLVEVGVGFDEDGWEFWKKVGSTTSARTAWDSKFLA